MNEGILFNWLLLNENRKEVIENFIFNTLRRILILEKVIMQDKLIENQQAKECGMMVVLQSFLVWSVWGLLSTQYLFR